MDGGFQLAHSGSGGMTSSLSVGTRGSAAVRRLMQFPLSPILTTGRSDINKIPNRVEDPRYSNVPATSQDLRMLAATQWPSRSMPVNSRAYIEAKLQEYE